MKTIFEKAYIVKAQAEMAAAKEFGADWQAKVFIDKSDDCKKYVVRESNFVIRSDISAERQAVAPKSNEEACIDAMMHEPKQHVSLAEALAESGERIEELVDGHSVQVVPGFTHCPHCEIHLSNGVGHDGQDVNGTPVHHETHLYECLACGGEFGPLLAELQAEKIANATMGGPRAKLQFSTIKSPVKRVWHIADSMPKAARKDVIAECVAQGVASGTARTQYQAWFKASQECERSDIRKPYEKA